MSVTAVVFVALMASAAAHDADANAQQPAFAWEDKSPERWSVHGQTTVVPQAHLRFVSPYEGLNSLTAAPQVAASWTATLFLAARPWSSGRLVVNPEIAAGSGLSMSRGVAGYPNGEIYRVDRVAPRFNWSRLFLQQIWRLGQEDEWLDPGFNLLAGPLPLRRLTLIVGKFSLNDYFDGNTYGHDPRTQFLNWALMDTGAYDYAADTRGYTWGLFVEANSEWGAVRVAAVTEPTTANGMNFDYNLHKAISLNVEAEGRFDVFKRPGKLRGLFFMNRARMGNYAEATAARHGGVPDLVATRASHNKLGGALNLEQNIAGNSGVFVRLGLADGRYESWAFTEIERSAALGGLIDGALWGQPRDRIGVAALVNGISDDHGRYLQYGGYGFIIGDSTLRKGPEVIVEAYYALTPWPWLTATLDYQAVLSPAYNKDRGPVHIAALRLHVEH